MASIHYDDLDGWWKSAGFWGILGTAIAVGVGLPLPWAAGGVLVGAVFGAVLAYLLWKMKLRALVRVDWILPFALAVPLYFVVDAGHGPRTSTIGFLALGSLFHAAKQLAFGLLGTRAMKVVNARNACWLSKLDPPVKRTGPPPAADTSEIALKLIAALPEPLASELRAKLKPVTSAAPFRSLQTIFPSASFFAGNPLLDSSLSWPVRNGKPLEFLAQLNLAEIPPTGHARPAQGLLAFFYDAEDQPWGHQPGDRDGTVVLYSPDPLRARAVLKPGSPPQPPIRKPLAFPQTPWLDFSATDRERIEDYYRNTSDELEADAVSDLYLAHQDLDPPGPHRVLSAPIVVQDDMDDDLAAAAPLLELPAHTPWTLLLQLDSDPDLDWQWGDMGVIYFWIPDEDLAAGRFDRVWTILQCT